MTTPNLCPSSSDLRRLLDGELSADAEETCTAHLETCECCQAKIETLATGGGDLSKVVGALKQAGPAATSAYWPALNALNGERHQAVAELPKRRAPSESLPLLEPSDDPAFLGKLAQFEIMRVIGRGGMGTVVEAFDSRLLRNVAIKLLEPSLSEDEVSRQRFCREARSAASITHENVIAVHQVEPGYDLGFPYLVMQLVAGESLEQRLKPGVPLPLSEIVRIGMQASHGLAAAHAQGLIHRDVKPGNILLEEPFNRVKLTDFGLARVADDAKLTRAGMVSGTPLYMSPEQAMGEEADERSDLFSLGTVIYEMAVGESPFTGNSVPVILKRIAEAKHRSLREVNPEIPEWLSTTVDRLLAKNPADRIQSACDLAELFDFEWAAIRSNSGELPAVKRHQVNRDARRRLLILTMVAGICLAIGFVAGVFAGRSSVHEAAPEAEPAQGGPW